jgi:hypothetical protein
MSTVAWGTGGHLQHGTAKRSRRHLLGAAVGAEGAAACPRPPWLQPTVRGPERFDCVVVGGDPRKQVDHLGRERRIFLRQFLRQCVALNLDPLVDGDALGCGSAPSQHAGVALMLRMDCILVIVAAR